MIEPRLIQRKKNALKIARTLAKLYPRAKVFLSHGNPWELLVATMLSAQCTDARVDQVTATLFKKYKTLNDYVRAKQKIFEQDIHATGFYRQKTKHILAAARIVREKFNGTVPRTMEELLTLPGVGRKTSNIVLQNAFGIVVGIPVDTHVRRLARRLGLTCHPAPEERMGAPFLPPRVLWPRVLPRPPPRSHSLSPFPTILICQPNSDCHSRPRSGIQTKKQTKKSIFFWFSGFPPEPRVREAMVYPVPGCGTGMTIESEFEEQLSIT